MEEHQHDKHNAMKWVVGGVALATGAVILSPYVLPLVGIGGSGLAANTMTALHAGAVGGGTGLAGLANSALHAIPLIGETLAQGGTVTALASGITGIGGVLLGRYIDKHEDGTKHIRWGKVIKTAALAASALIALPTVLTGISAGIAYLAGLESVELGTAAISFMKATVGVANGANLTTMGATVGAFATSHLLTCGAAAIPPLVSFSLSGHKHKGQATESLLQQIQGNPYAKQPHGQHHGHHHKAAPLATAAVTAAAGAHAGHEYAANDGKDAVLASVKLEQPTRAGEEVKGVLVLTHADTGKPLVKEELKLANEAIIHFFINNSSLTDYHHIHPTATDKPGEYAFNFKAATSQPYTGFAAIVTLPDEKHRSVKVAMPPAINRFVPPNVRMNSQVDVDGLSFDWKMDGPMQVGKPSNIQVTIKDARGVPVTDLQPVYGEWCHLEGFTANHGTMLHTHPTGREPQGKDDRMSSPLNFTITPDKDGPTQFYVQVKRGDKDIYAPIGQHVKAPEKATDRVTSRASNYSSSSSYGMGMA